MASDGGAMPSDFAAQFALLSAEFARRQGRVLAELDQRLADQGVEASLALLQEALDLLHRLAGSGGSFGYHDLSQQARALETLARSWVAAAQPVGETQWQAWKCGVHALAQILDPDRDPSAQ